MAKKVFVFLTDGFEEVEALSVVDFLRRAGAELTTVSISESKTVTGSHNIPVIADSLIKDIDADSACCIVLPGGPGAAKLAACAPLDKIIRDFESAEKLICAICAAPSVVLGTKGLLSGRTYTCYPGTEAQVRCESGCANWTPEMVVADGNLITGRGPGAALKFSLRIIEALFGKERATEIAEQTLTA
ncbi:MAG: DJ-1/PfpI family protein [Spirochaetaceae bacterium]|jgi:4-methyl-5(b-hydroxyethyl)-thiazole monophosphate biosynthesis|nr:DJ-1/PfpI family protein [Spirochaetaceae bacterium]GMO21525.1 MAG: DJ-1/PfpI family protein [Termitinemataceae bacterium]